MRIPEKLKFQLVNHVGNKFEVVTPTGLIVKANLDLQDRIVTNWKQKLESWGVDTKNYPLYSCDEATARKIKTFLNKEFKKKIISKDEYIYELVKGEF